jgi:predicted ATPase
MLLKNFKGWEDTGSIRLAPITVFFGSNSSGKTSLLQSILLLKQTAESSDRSRVLHPGDRRSLVDLGTVSDIMFGHSAERLLEITLAWTVRELIAIPKTPPPGELQFMLSVGMTSGGEAFLQHARYHLGQAHAAILRLQDGTGYDLSTVPALSRRPGRPALLPRPTRFYGFPDEVRAQFRNVEWLSDLAFALEKQLDRVHYVGPLRDYPQPSYVWAGERPENVGTRGENAIAALLAAHTSNREVGRGQGTGKRYTAFEAVVADWLKRMGLIHDFQVRRIAEQRKEYEVRIRRSRKSTEVLITHVGFGVSQVLPVLVQSYYAEQGSTVIFEQPEIHLHPRVQADLADVLIDAAKLSDVQFIVESHSEHFLRRLQRRVAESERITNADVALYVCDVDEGRSTIMELKVDEMGNITNWPKDFFGDDLDDLVAMSEAAIRRKSKS